MQAYLYMAGPTLPQPEVAPKPATAEAPKPLSPEVTQRRDKIAKVLDVDRFNRDFPEEDFRSLKKGWVDELREDLDPAIERAIADGNKEALVLQFADGGIQGTDTDFSSVYLGRFGAVAKTGNEEILLKPGNIKDILNNPDIPRIQQGDLPTSKDTVIVVDAEGNPTDLVVDTEIEGVRMQIDGQWTAKDGKVNTLAHIRPFLRVKVEEGVVSENESPSTESGPEKAQKPGEETDQVPAREAGEEMSPEDRISQTASSLQRAREEESNLIKAEAPQEEIDKASARVKDLEGLLQSDRQEARIIRLESQMELLISENGALRQDIVKLKDVVAELAQEIKDEEKKKSLLAKLAEIIAVGALGSAASTIKESGVASIPQGK